tara:strand:- start:371 stop:580 length:210 start_codon:yes stop_codon:yes gene_type:complete
MARVKAKVVVFIDNHLRQEGDVFNYDGPFNKHLEYLEGGPQAARLSDEEEPAPKLRPGRKPKAETSATE